MAENNETPNPTGNVELPAQTQRSPDNFGAQTPDCGAGCACNTAVTTSRIRWIIGAVILVIVAVLVVRAVTKTNGATVSASTDGFAAFPAAKQAPDSGAADASVVTWTPALSDTVVLKEISAISDLNAVAGDTNVVFVYLTDKNGSAKPPLTAMQSTMKTLSPQGIKLGLFALRTDSSDYAPISTQMSVPGVMVMVKGKGMSAVSGEITETKLIQAFVAASNTGGGCGPSGCAPSTPGCK